MGKSRNWHFYSCVWLHTELQYHVCTHSVNILQIYCSVSNQFMTAVTSVVGTGMYWFSVLGTYYLKSTHHESLRYLSTMCVPQYK